MADIESLYRKVDGTTIIEIDLSSVQQLFNSFDPAPFHEKALDRDAEQYIVDIVDDFPAKTPFKIVIYLPEPLVDTTEAQNIPEAIRNHFEYKAMVQNRDLRSRYRYGKFTILVGLAFLSIAMIASKTVSKSFADDPLAQLVATAMEVAGWVAMWEPVTVLLYELWPMIQMRKIYEKISRMQTIILPAS